MTTEVRAAARALVCAAGVLLFAVDLAAQGFVPHGMTPPMSFDAAHLVEGTQAAPPWSRHARVRLQTAVDELEGDGLALLRGDVCGGLGFPGGWELGAGFPVGRLFTGDRVWNSEEARAAEGFGLGDLHVGLLWTVVDAQRGGFGLLVGGRAFFPTGTKGRMLSREVYGGEGFAAASFQVLATKLFVNLGYRGRGGDRGPYPSWNELLWRVAIRVPRKQDHAWSVFASGSVPAEPDGYDVKDSTTALAGGGVDLPLSRANRVELFVAGGIEGAHAATVLAGITFQRLPVKRDEDNDGIGVWRDECPLLPEDKDGFEDDDGCPDLDNDRDGWPDDEDACPQAPAADDFSEDGC